MLFNSREFIFFFLPLVIAGFFWLGRTSHRLAALWLGAASLFFYGWWNPSYVLLLLASIAGNYGVGYAIGHAKGTPRAGRLLAAGITADLVLLGYFKYTNFFISTANSVAGWQLPAADIILPLGISFFTFTQIAFLVDVYRGLAREYDFIHYLLFVSYFPHLIAGPVLHHKQMMPQFAAQATYQISSKHIAMGITIFVMGLAKKVLLADNYGEFANPVFDGARDGVMPGVSTAWGGVLAYALQLYFDFSGYSDMAIGLSYLFGVRLPINFNSPYKASSIIEFWRRWHMTLSQFLRDYLYFPLGGNRKGVLRRHLNLMVTMLLGGLWHGASWTFVVWGGLHGLFLMVNHFWRWLCKRVGVPDTIGGMPGRYLATGLTFLCTMVAWVYFRADSIDSANLIIAGMAGASGTPDALTNRLRNLLVLGLIIVFTFPNTQQIVAKGKDPQFPASSFHPVFRPNAISGTALGVFFALLILMLARKSEFLYFQF